MINFVPLISYPSIWVVKILQPFNIINPLSTVFIRGMFISHIDSLFVGPFHGMSIFPLIHTVV